MSTVPQITNHGVTKGQKRKAVEAFWGLPPKPHFGDCAILIGASEDNPHRRGIFVRSFTRKGRINSGKRYEITDGKGDFWTAPPEACEIVRAKKIQKPTETTCWHGGEHEWTPFSPFEGICSCCGTRKTRAWKSEPWTLYIPTIYNEFKEGE